MNILVACEESQRVCTAFRAKGHRAFSCDIIEPSGNHPEWHIKADVLPILNGNCEFTTLDGKVHRQIGRWDMIIAFPPCTYMTAAGACRMYPQKGWISPERIAKAIQARDFFLSILHADCGKIAVENPKPLKVVQLPKESQRIQPHEFGEPYSKLTYLWLKGLPDLRPTNIVEPRETWIESGTHRNAGTQKKLQQRTQKKAAFQNISGHCRRYGRAMGIKNRRPKCWITPSGKEKQPSTLYPIISNKSREFGMKARIPRISADQKKQMKQEIDILVTAAIKEKEDALYKDLTRRILKTFVYVMHTDFGYGRTRLERLLKAFTIQLEKTDTVEVSRELKVMQCYGYKNNKAGNDKPPEIEAFEKKYQHYLEELKREQERNKQKLQQSTGAA